jgi:DNA-binding transcriptional MerR regulator
MAEALVTIGTFAVLTGLSVATLRHYDEIALLQPADVDRRTGYRRYKRSQVGRARTIHALRRLELPLEEIRSALDGDDGTLRSVLATHRARLAARGEELDRLVRSVDNYLEKGVAMQGVEGVRLVALNLGVTSLEELETATTFWSSLFGADFEDWGGGSLQMRLGTGDDFYLMNFRLRDPEEAQYGHRAAFGLLVDDLDDFHRRALAAGAREQVPPTDAAGMPRHSRFEDPAGNRVVLWQG